MDEKYLKAQRLGFFELPFIVFGMIPYTVVYLLGVFFLFNTPVLAGSFLILLMLFWVSVFKMVEIYTNNFQFYLKWLFIKKLKKMGYFKEEAKRIRKMMEESIKK